MNNAAILIIGYKRPEHLKNLVVSLRYLKSDISYAPIFLSIDGPRLFDKTAFLNHETQKIAKKLLKEKKISHLILRSKNNGTLLNITKSIDEVLKNYDYVLVLEDDLQLTKYIRGFFEKANKLITGKISAVSIYTNRPYSNVPFISKRFNSQGWMTSKDYWTNFNPEEIRNTILTKEQRKKINKEIGADLLEDFDHFQSGKLDTWAVPWNIYNFLNNKFMLYPTKSYVKNFSHEVGAERTFGVKFDYELSSTYFDEVDFNNANENLRYIKNFSFFNRFKRKIKSTAYQIFFKIIKH